MGGNVGLKTKNIMENLLFSELLSIVRVTDERLLGMQEYATKNNISAFESHPLCERWKRLSQFNQRAKNVLIEKIKELGVKEGIDLSDCFYRLGAYPCTVGDSN